MTGTSTSVGKTVATAAMTVVLQQAGIRVGVVKPVQTGTSLGERSDVDTVAALSGCRATHELAHLAEPLAPDTAARLRGAQTPTVNELADQLVRLKDRYDVVLLEGAGGVLVRLDPAGGTILGLATALSASVPPPDFVVVTTLALGTLNHTELTVGAIQGAGHRTAGLVFGSVSTNLGLAERCNLDELPRVTAVPVVARIPAGVGAWGPSRFQAEAATWFPQPRTWLTL